MTPLQLLLATLTFQAIQLKEAGLEVFLARLFLLETTAMSLGLSLFLSLLFVWFVSSFHFNGLIFVAVSVFVHCCSRYQQHD